MSPRYIGARLFGDLYVQYEAGDICILKDFKTVDCNKQFTVYINTEVEVLRPVDNKKLSGGKGYEVQAFDGTRFSVTQYVLRLLPVSESKMMRLPGDWAVIQVYCGWLRRSPTKEERITYGKV